MRGALMVVATVITTITFQPILNPPGGVWQTDVNVGLKWGLANCTQISLIAVVGVVLLIHTIRFLAWLGMKIRKLTLYMQRR